MPKYEMTLDPTPKDWQQLDNFCRQWIGQAQRTDRPQPKNATAEADGTFKEYFLRVPPSITRARDAVVWTFGMRPSQYKPDLES